MSDEWIVIPSLDMMMDYITGQWREEQEDKPLSLNSSLSAALNKCPVPWINGIAAHVGLDPKKLRQKKARVEAIVARLTDPGGLRAVLDPLPEQSRKALVYLLGQEGWSKIGPLTRQFGSMDDVGWFWDEKEAPASPLGQLRVHGLLFVGKAGIGGRNYRVAVIPVDLRQPLEELL
jgi:hypothetical protein